MKNILLVNMVFFSERDCFFIFCENFFFGNLSGLQKRNTNGQKSKTQKGCKK